MARFPPCSKYWVVRRSASDSALSGKVYAIEIPSKVVCSMPFTCAGGVDPDDLEDRGDDVDDVMELGADASRFDVSGPGHRGEVAGATEMGGHLFGPLER